MSTIADAIGTEIKSAKELKLVDDELIVAAKRLRFAWTDGHETLYKFKSLAGGACREVFDI
jgi:hypothetical protein